jgi:CHAT domain-containing protein
MMSRQPLSFGYVLIVSLGVNVLAGSGRAQPPAATPTPQAALRKADEHYQADRLLEAEPLYRTALSTTRRDQRRRCYDRLLAIYVRLGRPDQAISLGLRYQEWLRQIGDRSQESDLSLLFGESYLSLGHYRTADQYLQRALGSDAGGPSLSAVKRLQALLELARCAERRGDRSRATRFFREVEEVASAQLNDPARPLPPRERIECVWKLADSYRFQGQPGKALPQLAALLPVHDRLADPIGKRDTLRLLAGQHAARGEAREAEQEIRQALTLHEQKDASDRLTHADLTAELADMLDRQGKEADARRWRDQAAGHYQAVLKNPGAGRPGRAGALTAFWKLQKLYQNTSQYRKALELTATQAEQWMGGLLIEPRLKTEEGSLQILLGSYALARPLLRQAVQELEEQSPLDLMQLPRALNNLAVVEQATDEVARAETLGRKTLTLYRKYDLPEDLLLVETFNLLGTCAAQRGDYAAAIDEFREGVARCAKLGSIADPPHSNLLLNIALLHKAQGDLTEALRTCGQALTVYQRFAEPEALGLAAFAAAEASLHAALKQLPQANERAEYALRLCRKYEIDRDPVVVAARHYQALYRLSCRDVAAAEQAWQEVRALQEKELQPLLLPRTLNYLGLTAAVQGRLESAEQLYSRARQLQQQNPRAFPSTHFITLWQLANLVDRGGRRAEARALLDEAIAVIERARLMVYGDAKQRGAFFAQFVPGFEQLVEWNLRDRDVEAAFDAAARGRSRTLLDQLQMAGVDPRATLQGARGEQLRRQEADLRQHLTALQARVQLIPTAALQTDRARKLVAEFDQAQQEYAEAWREVLNASPVYRNLAARDAPGKLLATLRQHVLTPQTLMLVYHIGREQSSLLLLGDRPETSEAFRLTVPAGLPEFLAAEEKARSERRTTSRGLVLKRLQPSPAPLSPPPPGSPLDQALARTLVDHCRAQIEDPDFTTTRGLRLRAGRGDKPASAGRLELPVEVFLPAAVRQRIREAAPECLVVIPDGPLHKLPLEALLLEAGPRPRYVIDELPPIVYAPSSAILGLLAERQRSAPSGPLSLLTVANPAYPQPQTPAPASAQEDLRLLGWRGQLPLLPFTAEESRRIRRYFDADRVLALEGDRATEKAVLAALPGHRILHVAAHGFADERLGNLFGALALTPPAPELKTPDNDGFLSLPEICMLPLKDYDLAVLSACDTNVGPQQPLEAGITLASAFLTAGASRVVASHWSVDDRSTAELMGAFFAEVTAAAEKGRPASYARALQRARLKLRNDEKWSSPFYWAPFVLIGPPR